MAFSDKREGLRVEIDEGKYRITAAEAAKMETDLVTLRKLVATFPRAELKVEIIVLNPGQIRAETSLRLAGRTLHAQDDDRQFHPAWERAIRRLVKEVTEYKEKLSNRPTYAKEAEGTLHDVQPSQAPDPEKIEAAVREGNYPRFRQVMSVYEETMEGRVGRWVERYPEAAAALGEELTLSQIVEEVFLNAFEGYGSRPKMRLGQWLESLIDPSVRQLVEHREEEQENLSFVESAKAAEIESQAQQRRPPGEGKGP
jgi:ribosome-associated translation inhibitor RaiA